jgi:hypothetical protein
MGVDGLPTLDSEQLPDFNARASARMTCGERIERVGVLRNPLVIAGKTTGGRRIIHRRVHPSPPCGRSSRRGGADRRAGGLAAVRDPPF